MHSAQNILATKHKGELRLNNCHYWIKGKPRLSDLTQLFCLRKCVCQTPTLVRERGRSLPWRKLEGDGVMSLRGHVKLFQIGGSTDEEAADSAWGRTGNEGRVSQREGSIRRGTSPCQERFMLLTSWQFHEREGFLLWEWMGGVGKRKKETGSDDNSLKYTFSPI